MRQYHDPHTPEWFEAVSQVDRGSAEHAAKVVSLSGRPDVCGVCGDAPAADYCVPGVDMKDGTMPTMRLCADCCFVQRLEVPNLERLEGTAPTFVSAPGVPDRA